MRKLLPIQNDLFHGGKIKIRNIETALGCNGACERCVASGLLDWRPMATCLVFLTSTLFQPQYSVAQWLETGLVGDIDVSALAVQGDQIVAGLFGAGGNAQGVYISTDYGDSWLEENTGLTNTNVLTLAADSDELLAGTWGGGVFVRTGDQWVARNSGLTRLNINSIVIHDDVFFAGSGGGGVAISTNQGLQWTPSNSGLTSLWILSLFTDVDTLWAGAGSGGSFDGGNAPSAYGSFRSSNRGESWISSGLTGVTVSGFAKLDPWFFAAGNHGDGVSRTSNNGISWQEFRVGSSSDVRCYAVADSLLIAGTSEGVFVSEDWGETWTNVNSSPGPYDVRSLAIKDAYLFAGAWSGGVWKRPLSEILTDIDAFEEDTGSPPHFSLSQNYPNPFNAISNFGFSVLKSGEVSLKVYDLLGREVATVVEEKLAPGNYTRQWDAAGLASGVYLYRLRGGHLVQTRKLLLIR